jgi:Lipid A 3-O-deacylase (PagL)
MSVPSALKSLLLAGAFLAFVCCSPLNSICSTTPNQADGEDTGQVIPIFRLSSEGLAPPDSASESHQPDNGSSEGKTSAEGKTSVACPQDGKVVSADSSVSTSSCSAVPGRAGNGATSAADNPAKASTDSPIERVALTNPKPLDRNREIYYRNKTELALDLGTFPINIPFPFDFMEGDPYTEHPLKYTLVPIVLSLCWQMSDIGGPWIFRGNWDLTSSGSFTWIPSGPETRFISYDMGLRRNFVPRNRNYANYWDIRLGVGQINAKGPKGVPYAQGEDWPEFTMNLGTGVRYNFSPRFSFTAGINYMHISNMDLSEHKPSATNPNWGPINYGINVYGPQLGINLGLRKKLDGE